MYENIGLEDNAPFSQFQSKAFQSEDYFMPMDEHIKSPSPKTLDNGASSSTVHKKKKMY